ncbi:MAG: RNA-binding S4 domain-containing protein [Alphaproteobacteria bacterium]|nr:RNA-binding S4 domain-containing protein [Alphaproteobacteria bacterium]MDE2111917.1 RNA-binding S4 domain-containing protein [Alphaproteobacteria bacterium]MDE2493140.1 RNA-binding S4 domain-containing protein [Alphaproteobacteria bacterium]
MSATRLRLDKWLWCARFYRSRELARAACESGLLRLNGQRVEKAGREIKPGDVLTVPQAREIVLVRVLAGSARRGPAREAQQLYEIVADTTKGQSTLDPATREP